MKRVFAILVAAVLLLRGTEYSQANMLSAPPIPQRPPEAQRRHDLPVVSIAAGVVVVALTGSLVALRLIRKSNGP